MDDYYHNLVWGIQNDADEDKMVEQVKLKLNLTGDDESIKRKIYRQRVVNIANWENINQEKFSPLPMNQIPQRLALMDQILQNPLNDAWNEPTIIKVLIIHEDYNPISFDYIHDVFEVESSVFTRKISIAEVPKHPDQPYMWQFGIDRLKIQEFVQSWLTLER